MFDSYKSANPSTHYLSINDNKDLTQEEELDEDQTFDDIPGNRALF